MKNKSILACLLMGASLTSAINSMAIATAAIDRTYAQSQNPPAPTPDFSKATLTLQDFPPGFTPASFIEGQEEQGKNDLGKLIGEFKPESIFGFENKINTSNKQYQFVLGITGQIPETLDRASFDAYASQNNFARQFITKLNEDKEFNFSNVTALPLPDNIGQFSAGWTSRGTIQGVPVRLDAAMFGRGKLVACLLTLYLEGNNSIVPISELARKLDDRIIQLSPPAETQRQ